MSGRRHERDGAQEPVARPLTVPQRRERKSPADLQFLQGNEVCAEAALYAGLRFFAGYPITPSTEIAE
ncbi:hypothetical protein, partial [Salinispira pacifica]